jgi:hypothetical protein
MSASRQPGSADSLESGAAASRPDNAQRPFRARLPGFVVASEIGIGDAIGRATAYFGLRPCGGCAKRQATLNQWVVVSPRRPK